MSGRFQISMCTVVLLVLVRLSVGWQFYSEGMKKHSAKTSPSAGFLKSAVGPLARYYQRLLPPDEIKDLVNNLQPVGETWDKYIAKKTSKGTKTVQSDDLWKGWLKQQREKLKKSITKQWGEYLEKAGNFYEYDEAQKKRAKVMFRLHQEKLNSRIAESIKQTIDEFQDELREYRERQKFEDRFTSNHQQESAFDETRVMVAQAYAKSNSASLIVDLKNITQEYQTKVLQVRTEKQIKQGGFSNDGSTMKKFDIFLACSLTTIGICLMVGLFTRLAAFSGAMFLLSVMGTQPFWIEGANLTYIYYQSIEFFLLLTLATTAVGRWGGLDFFIHQLLCKCCHKGSKNASV